MSYLSYTIKVMKRSGTKPNLSIRIDRDALHQARIAAVTARKTLGAWLEDAIAEKLERDQGGTDVTTKDC